MPRVLLMLMMATAIVRCSDESKADRQRAGGQSPQTVNSGTTTQFVFTWDAPSSSDDIIEYQLDYSVDNAPMAKLLSIRTDSADFNFSQPFLMIKQDEHTELQAPVGTNFCFELIARSSSGESQPSTAACGSI